MNYNMFLLRFGLNPDNFVNKEPSIIDSDDAVIYEVIQDITNKRECPFCHNKKTMVKDHDLVQINASTSLGKKEFIRINKTRLKCPSCHKTFTPPIEGIERYERMNKTTIEAIRKEFFLIQSFKQIAERFNVAIQTIINIFDEYTKYVPRREMPEYLCIDEKHFEGDTNGKYCVVISDFFSGEVIDVLPNRQKAYLNEYFDNIPLKEREKVKVFISDMYDEYRNVKDKYFQKALFVVDLFHVIKLISEVVKKIRIRVYNQIAEEGSIEKHFMKSNWKAFQADLYKITNKPYTSDKFGIITTYGDMITRCIKLSNTFWDTYTVLQELIHYDKYDTYTQAEHFIKDRIIVKLENIQDELTDKVAASYKKWLTGICSGLAKNQTGKRFSNAIAECNNSHIQRIIDVSYGYRNFNRFRNRIMLIMTYNPYKKDTN